MKQIWFLLLNVLLVFACTIASAAQAPLILPHGFVRPPSALGKLPIKVRTPLYVFKPEHNAHYEDLASSGVAGENPASLACIYGLVPLTPGCPTSSTVVPTGGGGAIALVEWGDFTDTQNDLDAFSKQFGLPLISVTKICLPTPPCPNNYTSGWDVETDLDVEYAHAMAPAAKIFVVEFTNNVFTDGAETEAGKAVAAAGGGEVSNSFTQNGGESFNEKKLDKYFTTPGVVYFASAGDNGWGPVYPSVSPNVISAGGTSILRDAKGNFMGENCWWGSGGGISQFERRPTYQNGIRALTGYFRGTPDLALDADPFSGVAIVYDGGWNIVGGTSVASPALAGIVNSTTTFRASSKVELTQIYNEYGKAPAYHNYFNDITIGSNGLTAAVGWDQCTGVGSTKNPFGY